MQWLMFSMMLTDCFMSTCVPSGFSMSSSENMKPEKRRNSPPAKMMAPGGWFTHTSLEMVGAGSQSVPRPHLSPP